MSMSAAEAVRPGALVSEPPARHLRTVSHAPAATKPKLLYAVVAVAAALGIVAAQLLLSIGVQQGAYRIEGLQAQKATLTRSVQAASEQAGTLNAPQNLAAKAQQLGMVASTEPVYLRLSDGAVIGAPKAANATVTGNLVPNALLTAQENAKAAKAKAAKANAAPAAAAAAADQGTPAANDATVATGPVPWDGALPAPETH